MVKVNNIDFDATHLNHSEIFGLSPFALDLSHPDAPFECVASLYNALKNLPDSDKDRIQCSKIIDWTALRCLRKCLLATI